MPFRRKILYYGLMLGLTLLALEGMARIAYYAAYGQWYGRGGSEASVRITPPPHNFPSATATPLKRHPIYGYIKRPPYHGPQETLPRQRQEGTVVIGLLGGSVAQNVQPYLERALGRWFAENRRPQPPALLNWAAGGAGQPEQTMLAVNTLLLGGEVDFIINLDGVNEITNGARHRERGFFPFFPYQWQLQVGLTAEEVLLAGRIGALRREQARLAAVRETSPLRRSALFGLTNRYRQENAAAEIIRRNHELAATQSAYNLEKHGPRSWLETEDETLAAAARLWYRSSVMLARLVDRAGAEYYHFLQPNQYAPAAKPLSPKERDIAYKPDGATGAFLTKGYPLLTRVGRDLPKQGVNYFDLTGIFADHPETLYIDDCCHLNDRGKELLAAAIVRRLEPALLRRRGASAPESVSAGNATAPRPADFQVSLQDDGKYLRYIRADCATGDTAPRFFLHLIPQDLADLPPGSREPGFDNRVFSFAEVGGRLASGQCAAQIPLPDYPLAALRTGQFVPGEGDLWSVELIVPADPDKLRADYAAVAAVAPVARDYFDLYELDNRLFYLRETCAAADTAAPFFLHIIPEDAGDLPVERREAGFVHSGFDFARQGGPFDGKCLAAVSLPDYPIKEMRTGQHIPGQGDLWSVELIAAPDLEQLRGDYAALAAVRPTALGYFDLYLRDNRLLYLRETCAAADTAANFFLHIVPESPADLPAARRAAGFAHGGFEFVRQGGHFDGKCLAAVSLPEYPIKEMRTGQHIPGQGDLWSVAIAVP